MAKKKTIEVKDVLDLMEESDRVTVILYAYGIYYADTARDGMETVADCLEKMNLACLKAMVTRIKANRESSDIFGRGYVVIKAEIVH